MLKVRMLFQGILAFALAFATGCGGGSSSSLLATFLYVSNTDSGTVSVIDTATNTEVATVNVGSEPRGLDILPGGSLVFVPNRFSNSVSVISTATNTVVATIALSGGGEPYNCAALPDGSRVYVVNKSGNSASDVSVIDVATRTEMTLIPLTGTGPEGLAVSPGGAFVYVVNRDSGDVEVIETATNTVIATGLQAPSSPRDAAFTPDGQKVYVVGEGDMVVLPGGAFLTGNLAVSQGTVISGARGRDVVVSQDGAFAYVANKSAGNVTVVDTATDTVAATIPLTTSGAYGIDITKDGKTAYVSNDGGKVAVVDLVTRTQVGTITGVGSKATQLKVTQTEGAAGGISAWEQFWRDESAQRSLPYPY